MKKIILLIVLILAFSCTFSIFAAPMDAVVENFDVIAQSDTVTVSGNVSPAGEYKLSYMILYPDKTQADLTVESFDEVVAAIGEISTDKDGGFITSFPVKDNTPDDLAVDIDTYYPRTYKAYLTLDGYEIYPSTDFLFTGSSYARQIIKKINEAKQSGDTTLMQSILNKYYEKLSVENSLYEQKIITDSEKSSEFVKVFTAMPQISETDFVKFKEQFMDVAVTTLVNKAASDTEMAEIISTYSKELKLDETSEYMTYTSIIGEELRKEVRTYAINGTFTSSEDFSEKFRKFTVMRSINGVLGWDNVRQSVEANYAVIGINLENILPNDNKSEIYGRMINQSYADYPSIVEGFNAAVIASRQIPSLGGGSGSNAGGGSGGGRGSSGGGLGSNILGVMVRDTNENYFTDLGGFEWAENAINTLAVKNIISGRGNNNFEPSAPVYREEFVKMIVLASGNYDEWAEADFSDVDKNGWYYPYVASAFKNNIISGMENGMFGVGQNITREDMAVIIARLMGYNADLKKNADAFSDADEISDYAKTAVAFVWETGIVTGSDGKFNPKSSLTRAEAAVVINRFMAR